MSETQAIAAIESPRNGRTAAWALLVVLIGVLIWTFWSTMSVLFKEWQNDDNYSVGQLVPLAMLYMMWHDRARIRETPMRMCWWGLGVILVAQAARFAGMILLFESAERYAFVLSIAGLVMLVAGWKMFWLLRWILLFGFLMVPLPGHIHNMISGPLQDYATTTAVVVLEMIGTLVTREGHIIVLNDDTPLAVAEACSGLRMLTAFVVVGCVLAYVVGRPGWQKAIIVLSTVPVAIVCNTIRLVVTALLFMVTSSELAERFFHDFAGITMMPIAIMLLIFELWVLSKLVIDESEAAQPAVGT